jgi:glycosyltransferase involved in cell wall biosynthesis
MKKRRTLSILLISPFFHPHTGGSQRYMEELYVHIHKKHPGVAIDVLTYNTDHAPAKEVYRGITIYRIRAIHVLTGQFILPNIVSLVRWLWRHPKGSYDIVHTHIRFFDATWWAWAYARIIGATSVFTEHVASHPIHEQELVTVIARLIDKTIARWSISRYDCITATNKSARTFLKYTMGVQKTVYLTYGGVDTKFFSPKRETSRRIPHVIRTFGNADTIITYAGRIIWSKGITYFYRAVRDSIAVLPPRVYVVFAGPGDLLPDIREEIAKDHLEHRIFTTGALSSKEVRNLLRATDIFVHPSHHKEGFPNVILEAGASENFVIATQNAGVEEAMTDKKTGFIIEQKNEADMRRTLRWAVDHPDKRRVMAHAFRGVIRRTFEWNKLSDRFYVLLKQQKEAHVREHSVSWNIPKMFAWS